MLKARVHQLGNGCGSPAVCSALYNTGPADLLGLHQELLHLKSKVSMNKYVARAEGWAAAVRLQPQASALLTSRSLCTALGNN